MTAVDTATPRWGSLPSEDPVVSAPERREVLQGLSGALRWDHLRRTGERCWEIVRRDEQCEAWLIAWPPGGRAHYHDHGPSSGSVLVLEGELLELTPRLRRDDQLRIERNRYAAGSLLEFEPGHVHDLVNEGDRPAVSLHVYSPRLEFMTYFDLGPRGIIERETHRVGRPRLAPASSVSSVAQLLAAARAQITRVAPSELPERVARGALVVDIRPEGQRRSEGQLGFGVVVERNVLEWRFDLEGPDCLPAIQSYDQQVIVVCSEGYASSLAAATLRELGYPAASDLEGGFRAWQKWSTEERAGALSARS